MYKQRLQSLSLQAFSCARFSASLTLGMVGNTRFQSLPFLFTGSTISMSESDSMRAGARRQRDNPPPRYAAGGTPLGHAARLANWGTPPLGHAARLANNLSRRECGGRTKRGGGRDLGRRVMAYLPLGIGIDCKLGHAASRVSKLAR